MKSKTVIPEGWTYLLSQSTLAYALLKNEAEKLYYIKRVKDSKMALVGDADLAELYILYGIEPNKQDLTELKFT